MIDTNVIFKTVRLLTKTPLTHPKEVASRERLLEQSFTHIIRNPEPFFFSAIKNFQARGISLCDERYTACVLLGITLAKISENKELARGLLKDLEEAFASVERDLQKEGKI